MPMIKTFRIELPEHLEESAIAEYFCENLERVLPAMDLELEDDRAHIDEIEIEHVALSDASVQIKYKVQYSEYYGCKDMNYVDEDWRTITGRRKGRSFEFDEFEPPPSRTSYEEY